MIVANIDGTQKKDISFDGYSDIYVISSHLNSIKCHRCSCLIQLNEWGANILPASLECLLCGNKSIIVWHKEKA